jgi:hypothetical protein
MKRLNNRQRGQAENGPVRAKRIAQCFSPGERQTAPSPCKGGRSELFFGSRVSVSREDRTNLIDGRLKVVTRGNNVRLYNWTTNSGALTGCVILLMQPWAKALGYALSPHRAASRPDFCGLSLELYARSDIGGKTALPKAVKTAGIMMPRLTQGYASDDLPRRVATISLERRVVSKQ